MTRLEPTANIPVLGPRPVGVFLPGFDASGPQQTTLAGRHRYLPVSVSISVFWSFINTSITRITPHTFLFTVQQPLCLGDVMDIRRRPRDAVNQPQCIVRANMHLHAKVPLVALLSLVHLRVLVACLVLGRCRRGNDTGINDRAFLQY